MEKHVTYQDHIVGDGPAADNGALCFAKFVGILSDGTLFDSTERHGKPFEFVLGSKKVIPGWSEACRGMCAGGTRSAHVPASLAYGEKGNNNVPPNSELFYEIEMIEVRPRE